LGLIIKWHGMVVMSAVGRSGLIYNLPYDSTGFNLERMTTTLKYCINLSQKSSLSLLITSCIYIVAQPLKPSQKFN
jgi:hypothetical protein